MQVEDATYMEAYGGANVPRGEMRCRVLISLLGAFRLLVGDQEDALRVGSKAEALLTALALRPTRPVPRDTLLRLLWTGSEPELAGQALNSLVYSLHKLLGSALAGGAPIVHTDGSYQLNATAGVGVDVSRFEALIHAGEHYDGGDDRSVAISCYRQAVGLYRGDLSAGTDVHTVVERERLRALFLTLLARLADYHCGRADYAVCLDYALRLLAADPYREDAHRLVMRCYVRRGERAQALRQYRLCETILRAEFDVEPEPATVALFNQVRLDPDVI